MLVLEPIFEADLPPEQYAYRPGEMPNRRWSRWKGCCSVAIRKSLTPTVADYYRKHPHAELLQSVARRIVDRRVLHLIKMWLECPVKKPMIEERKTRNDEARDNRATAFRRAHPISPLLANIYMRRSCWG